MVSFLLSACYESGAGGDADVREDVTPDADSADTPVEADVPDQGEEELPPDWAACSVPSDCVLENKGCCDPCGVPSLDDYDAINSDWTDEHSLAVCADPVPCPLCLTAPNPELLATCIEGRCTGVDIGAEDFSACTADDECVIRVPDCCECGADTSRDNLIAFRHDAWSTLLQLLCDPMVDCPMCEPIYPADAEPFCDEDGHCAVRFIPTP